MRTFCPGFGLLCIAAMKFQGADEYCGSVDLGQQAIARLLPDD
jgi:hypothetical protein